jgi:Flp pilus assembly protein CpaB
MTLMWALLIVFAIIAVAACGVAARLAQRLSQLEIHIEAQHKHLSRDLAVVNSAAMGVGQRLSMAEKKLRLVNEKQQQIEGQQVDYLPYNQVAEGVNAEQLIDRYGFSEAEASLLSRLKAGADSQKQALAES